jgi:hypothetical protein
MKKHSTLNEKSFKGNSYANYGFAWRLLLSFCISMFGVSSAFAQIVTDGNPADWHNFTTLYPAHALVIDVVNASGNTDDQFTQGSKDENMIQAWRWSNGSANAKGDIATAGAVLDGCILHFFVDRHAMNGDAAIGFWFLKDGVSKAGAKKFSGIHQDGDILVLSHFTNGGGSSDIFRYEWDGINPGSLVFIGSSTTAQVNTQLYPVPNDWTYTTKDPKLAGPGFYPAGAFYEGEINVCNILGQAPCFASFLAETRNSQSLDASLQDFALGGFTTDVAAPIVAVETEPSICGPATGCVIVDANAPRAGTYTLTQPNVANSTQVFTYPTDGNEVRFCGLVAGEGFSVIFATSSGCTSEAAVCPSNTRQTTPKASAKPTGATQLKQSQSAEKDLIAYPVPFSDKVNVKFTATRAEKYSINLYDMNGKMVKELRTGNAKPGEVITMELSSKGLLDKDYIVRKVSKSGTSTLRITKEQ